MKGQIKELFPSCDASELGHNKNKFNKMFTECFSLKHMILCKISKNGAERWERKVPRKFMNPLTAYCV